MNKPNVFLTADFHFGHRSIIRLCNRPFSTVEEMDSCLIDNYNEIVKPEDYVYILGDFSFRSGKNLKERYFDKLNGKKVLIKGNHDGKETLRLPWHEIHDVLHLKIKWIPGYGGDKREIFLSHYAHRTWNKSFHGIPHAFGHSHGKLPSYGKSFDVGVDCWNYTPISLDFFMSEINKL